MSDIINIDFKGKRYATIIPNDYCNQGVTFLTDGSYSQQLAYMSHPSGKVIDSHVHNRATREVEFTQEVLVLKRGKLRVDFYDISQQYFGSIVLNAGDVILLANGGHGFKVIEDLDMIEIKQGPYLGEHDKERFIGIEDKEVTYIKG